MNNPAHPKSEDVAWQLPNDAASWDETRSMLIVTTRKIRTETDTQRFYVDAERFRKIHNCDITQAPAELVERFCLVETGASRALRGEVSESSMVETFVGFNHPDDEQFRI